MCVVYVAFPNTHEARDMCCNVVEEKYASAAHIYENTNSIYWWNDKLHKTKELVAAFITTDEGYAPLCERLLEIHPYEQPAIMKVKIAGGHPPTMDWVDKYVDKK